MRPTWLTVVGWIYLSACFCCPIAVAYDILVNHRRQHMGTSSAAFWLLTQVGMIIGFFTSWPANVWRVKRGIQVPM